MHLEFFFFIGCVCVCVFVRERERERKREREREGGGGAQCVHTLSIYPAHEPRLNTCICFIFSFFLLLVCLSFFSDYMQPYTLFKAAESAGKRLVPGEVSVMS
jgi:hypothetical protein